MWLSSSLACGHRQRVVTGHTWDTTLAPVADVESVNDEQNTAAESMLFTTRKNSGRHTLTAIAKRSHGCVVIRGAEVSCRCVGRTGNDPETSLGVAVPRPINHWWTRGGRGG